MKKGLAVALALSSLFAAQQARSQDTAQKSLTIVVNASPVVITPASLPQGMAGLVYTAAVTASGGLGPYTFTVSSGSLPAGVSLSSSGAFTGTPSAAGTSTFTVKVSDAETTPQTATQSYTVTILQTLSITTTSLPAANLGIAYSGTIQAAGGLAPYTFAITTGSLPAGLIMNASTGLISGTPTTPGTFNFTVTVTDSATNVAHVVGSSVIVAESRPIHRGKKS